MQHVERLIIIIIIIIIIQTFVRCTLSASELNLRRWQLLNTDEFYSSEGCI